MPFFIFIIGCLYIIFKKLIIYISYIAISPTLYINASFSNTLYQGIFSNNLSDRVFINHAVNIPDDFFIYELSNVLAIPTHAPHAGSDGLLLFKSCISEIFLSTLPMRGATVCILHSPDNLHYFYPRSPCGERHCADRDLYYR